MKLKVLTDINLIDRKIVFLKEAIITDSDIYFWQDDTQSAFDVTPSMGSSSNVFNAIYNAI